MVNSVLAKIDGKDYAVQTGSINYILDKVSTFSLSVLASELTEWRDIFGVDAEVFCDGVS